MFYHIVYHTCIRFFDLTKCFFIIPLGTASEHQRLLKPLKIGTMPQMTKEQSLEALYSAVSAWDGGSGVWPQMSLADRIDAIQNFMVDLKKKREDIVNVLMYEIGKNKLHAEAEFDRTMQFIDKTIEYIQHSFEFGNARWDASNGDTRLFTSRAAIGIVLCLGPYNYPMNETYATLIPALLMGNVAILKIRRRTSSFINDRSFRKSFACWSN